MTWPWKKRQQEAQRSYAEARRELDKVVRRWPVVRELERETQRQAELNGWTRSIKAIMSGGHHGN